jgi:hypothetical protein
MEYTLSDGRIIPLRRVARRYIEQIRAKHEIPDPPTYTFKAAGGVEVTKVHDEESVAESGPEDKAAWHDYREAKREATALQEGEVVQFLIYQAIALDPPPVEEWSVDFKLFGIEPPSDEDPKQFKVAWFEYELLTDEDDYAPLITRLYEMGGLVDSDRADEFESIFRLVLQRLAVVAGTKPAD